MRNDTIAAIATPVGVGGIGIVRISGPEALPVGDRVFRARRGTKLGEAKGYTVHYGEVVHPETGASIDEALALVMRAPASYTREDVVELHCHGGPLPLRLVLEAVLAAGARLAEPGEFTARAFLNGRIDLAQAEAVADIICAQTEASLRLAQMQLKGRLSEKIRALREALVALAAELEVGIDFPEDDIPELTPPELAARLEEVIRGIEKLIAGGKQGRILREGLPTVILGKPNVGKSSLLNALVGERRALVTDVPGTTRDVIEEVVNIRGIPVRLLDTAGIRETSDLVERLGVEATKERLGEAELVLFMLDAERGWEGDDAEILALCQGRATLVLVNKLDVGRKLTVKEAEELCPGRRVIGLSVKEGWGIEALEEAIAEMVYGGAGTGEYASVSNIRHLKALEAARENLKGALEAARKGFTLDVISTAVRASLNELGKITGEAVDEEVVEHIFHDFCVGK
ncbi:MAG: tRNA modification GTPase [Bacillota bacterium]|jgi:tRNA modification GTPase|nr:tRNA modification GTPase [Bacillota bacterium]MDK2881901.1 tRNA modification GTPase [Bacillota bacterium]MDK2924819.1 tRNA modification GTPase [Bacillota bacterium]